MKKYYVVEVSEYAGDDTVDKTHIVRTAHPEEIYNAFTGPTTLSFNVRNATWAERREAKQCPSTVVTL